MLPVPVEEAVIVVDPLFDTTPFTRSSTPRCFRNTQASHMMSTLDAEAGRDELIEFGKRLGLRAAWLQHPGTKRQHFDLVASRYRRALRLGAVPVPAHWQAGDPLPA